MQTCATKLTAAGKEMLARFVEREGAGQLVPLISHRDGSAFGEGMPLRHGDGGDLACAQKLSRDGLIRLVGQRHRRFVIITDCGRAALGNQPN